MSGVSHGSYVFAANYAYDPSLARTLMLLYRHSSRILNFLAHPYVNKVKRILIEPSPRTWPVMNVSILYLLTTSLVMKKLSYCSLP